MALNTIIHETCDSRNHQHEPSNLFTTKVCGENGFSSEMHVCSTPVTSLSLGRSEGVVGSMDGEREPLDHTISPDAPATHRDVALVSTDGSRLQACALRGGERPDPAMCSLSAESNAAICRDPLDMGANALGIQSRINQMGNCETRLLTAPVGSSGAAAIHSLGLRLPNGANPPLVVNTGDTDSCDRLVSSSFNVMGLCPLITARPPLAVTDERAITPPPTHRIAGENARAAPTCCPCPSSGQLQWYADLSIDLQPASNFTQTDAPPAMDRRIGKSQTAIINLPNGVSPGMFRLESEFDTAAVATSAVNNEILSVSTADSMDTTGVSQKVSSICFSVAHNGDLGETQRCPDVMIGSCMTRRGEAMIAPATHSVTTCTELEIERDAKWGSSRTGGDTQGCSTSRLYEGNVSAQQIFAEEEKPCISGANKAADEEVSTTFRATLFHSPPFSETADCGKMTPPPDADPPAHSHRERTIDPSCAEDAHDFLASGQLSAAMRSPRRLSPNSLKSDGRHRLHVASEQDVSCTTADLPLYSHENAHAPRDAVDYRMSASVATGVPVGSGCGSSVQPGGHGAGFVAARSSSAFFLRQDPLAEDATVACVESSMKQHSVPKETVTVFSQLMRGEHTLVGAPARALKKLPGVVEHGSPSAGVESMASGPLTLMSSNSCAPVMTQDFHLNLLPPRDNSSSQKHVPRSCSASNRSSCLSDSEGHNQRSSSCSDSAIANMREKMNQWPKQVLPNGSLCDTTCTSSRSQSGSSCAHDTCIIPLKEDCTVIPPLEFFTDVDSRLQHLHLLQSYSEYGIIHEWDTNRGVWDAVQTAVLVYPEPFSKGNMRASYHVVDLGRLHCRLVAKRYLMSATEERQYFDDASMHTVGGHWARIFNAQNPPKKVTFLPAAVLRLPYRKPPLVLGLEPLLKGQFMKYNNNCGFVLKESRWTPQAFSHFTYHASYGQLMIVDIQGVDDYYTDPQILSADGEGYGCGNLGTEGFERFLESHRCNEVCKAMGLPVQRHRTPAIAMASQSPVIWGHVASYAVVVPPPRDVMQEILPPRRSVVPPLQTMVTGGSRFLHTASPLGLSKNEPLRQPDYQLRPGDIGSPRPHAPPGGLPSGGRGRPPLLILPPAAVPGISSGNAAAPHMGGAPNNNYRIMRHLHNSRCAIASGPSSPDAMQYSLPSAVYTSVGTHVSTTQVYGQNMVVPATGPMQHNYPANAKSFSPNICAPDRMGQDSAQFLAYNGSPHANVTNGITPESAVLVLQAPRGSPSTASGSPEDCHYHGKWSPPFRSNEYGVRATPHFGIRGGGWTGGCYGMIVPRFNSVVVSQRPPVLGNAVTSSPLHLHIRDHNRHAAPTFTPPTFTQERPTDVTASACEGAGAPLQKSVGSVPPAVALTSVEVVHPRLTRRGKTD